METETASMTGPQTSANIWPFALYAAAVLLMVGGMVALSHFLGQRHRERSTGKPYESGIMSTGSSRVRFNVKFYMVAMFFVIFDLEAAFIFTWAIAFRQLGWQGYTAIVIFISVLAAVLVYLWRIGALDWSTGLNTGRPREATTGKDTAQ